MDILLIVLISLIIIDCILLVVSILFQEDKSGGGIGILGGSSQSFFGASSNTILVKITTILLVIFLILSIAIAFVSSRGNASITAQDIYKTASSEDLVGAKKQILNAPERILASIYDKEIQAKITNETDKKIISANYSIDSAGKYYSLKKDTAKEIKSSIVRVLNSIGFSLESQSTVINTDATSDATGDK